MLGLVALSACSGGTSDLELDAATSAEESTSTTTTEKPTTTTTEPPTTTTTLPEAPEGGFRSTTADVAEPGTTVPDEVDREAVAYEDLARLETLMVAPESHADSYDRSLFPHWDDDDHDGCDTRCEVLTAQRQADGSWFSEWDGATEVDSSLVHIDHVVALAEAWRSGAWDWTAADRDAFADDRTNLIAVTASSNMRKSDKDAADWFPSRFEANCLWSRTVLGVKEKWSLSVDAAEKEALANLLTSCGAVPPTTTTAAPPPPPTTAVTVAPSGDCTPGYSPCLPPASDYDCSGGSGNGPAYTGRVSVDHSHGDPYGLDSDGDGVACE